jgi:glycosyltransferase involved in cell wall biosynthesis
MLPPEGRRGLEYWIVGVDSSGKYEARLRESAARQPDLTVRFFGGLPDGELSDVYERADIFALTSTHVDQSVEGFGLVYLEAAAHGLPVVAHDVGGAAEAMLDGVTGLLVPSGRPAQLAAAFEKLIHDPGLRKKLGAAGREWATRHRWQDSAATLFDPGRSAP